eukprot:4397105-Prorocentrum_lima.AAC.1
MFGSLWRVETCRAERDNVSKPICFAPPRCGCFGGRMRLAPWRHTYLGLSRRGSGQDREAVPAPRSAVERSAQLLVEGPLARVDVAHGGLGEQAPRAIEGHGMHHEAAVADHDKEVHLQGVDLPETDAAQVGPAAVVQGLVVVHLVRKHHGHQDCAVHRVGTKAGEDLGTLSAVRTGPGRRGVRQQAS